MQKTLSKNTNQAFRRKHRLADSSQAAAASFRGRYKLRLTKLMVIAAMSFVFLFSIFKLVMSQTSTHSQVITPDSNVVVKDSSKAPSEIKPVMAINPKEDSYQVPNNDARRILIPSIEVNGYIQKIGTSKDSEIGVPSNTHFAGWYTDSVRPGDPGLSIIDGHVGGRYSKDAVFSKLNGVAIGTKFQIEYGDLSTNTFEVVSTKQVPVAYAIEYLLERDEAITSQLNLITCGGEYDKSAESFKDRIIVVSKLIN
jgi:sortase (surface protein transpeptidase)